MQSVKFQEDNVKSLANMLNGNNRVLLADETGLGKTYTTALLIAGLAVKKYKGNKNLNYKVLYICSSERIARKNMGELCGALSEATTIDNAAKILNLAFNSQSLLSKEEAKRMAGNRGARLSLDLPKYDSFIQIYNATPDTSFRASNSISAGGTAIEFYKLMQKDKKSSLLNDEEIKIFAEKRKEAVVNNFIDNEFDLIVLDEYQSYEDILPVGENYIDNKNNLVGTTISELLEKSPNTKVLMLSATPYQSVTKEPDKFKDFRGILSFLSSDENAALIKTFDEYNRALYDKKTSFDDLINYKNFFEKELQKYCRRNQRADAFCTKDKTKILFSEPSMIRQAGFLAALKEEMITRRDALLIRKEAINTVVNNPNDELSMGILQIQMERDTGWGYSFSKDYDYRKKIDNSKKLYGKIVKCNNLLINSSIIPKEEVDSKRCDQSMLENIHIENNQIDSGVNEHLECKRLFTPGTPQELCDSKKWPNFKMQAIREISTEEKNDIFPDLYNCIWLPPSAPDYEPDKNSPYHKFYGKNPTKTIVFSRYKMTTRSIAALLSIEAAKDGGLLGFCENDWNYLCNKPEEKSDIIEKGHPFFCAYNALNGLSEEERSVYSEKIATELVEYFKRPEIQAVLARVGVKNTCDILEYCKNGNLTAVLREYLNINRIDISSNSIILYAAKKIPEWKKLSPAKRLKEIYALAWEEMIAANPDKILKNILNRGFETEYIDKRKEPYDGIMNGKVDGFKEMRISAWKTWFAYQLIYGQNSEKIKERLREAVGNAIERKINNNKTGIKQTSFNANYYIAYPGYKVNNHCIKANTKESCIMKRYYADSLTFDGKFKVPERYITGWYANCANNIYSNVDAFFLSGVEKRIKEKEAGVKKSNISKGLVLAYQKECQMEAWHTDLFSYGGVISELWYEVEDNTDSIFGLMPQMHVCADFKNYNRVLCGRIPLGFASRYTNEIQDSNDHNDNGAEEIMKAFNSPFYPFVLAVTDTAKEGLNFHNYCRRLIHLSIPDRAAVLIQREGRVDRFRSLVLRQRLAKANLYKISDWEAKWKEKIDASSNGMIPDWYIDMDDGPQIEKYYLINDGTDDAVKVENIENDASLFKRMLGSFLEDNLLTELKNRYKDYEDRLTELKLNLIP